MNSSTGRRERVAFVPPRSGVPPQLCPPPKGGGKDLPGEERAGVVGGQLYEAAVGPLLIHNTVAACFPTDPPSFHIAEVTDRAAEALADRYGRGAIEVDLRAHVVTAYR